MKIDIQLINEIAIEAGKLIMDVYQNIPQGLIIDKKDDDSPLTEADRAANGYICAHLLMLYPEIPIISEENKLMDYETRKNWDYAWLVDPLDGTKEFIKRNGEFTVNIALLHNGQVIAGSLYAPAIDELYYAEKGKGAYMTKDGETVKMSVKSFSKDEPGLVVVASRSHINEETKAFIDKLNQPEVKSRGSSLKFMLIAQGLAHLYPRIAPTMEWDSGAAHVILEEAGGRILRYDNGEPLQYNKENLLNPYFLALGNSDFV